VVVALVATTLVSLYALRTLSAFDFDPSVFVAFGEDEVATREYAEDRLDTFHLRPKAGHDGKFYFVQANDPLILDPDANAVVLDRPLYRSQRMLYPLIAGVGGLLDPEAIVWSMLVVKLITMGLGSLATASIARQMGGSPWWGLAFALNLGFISEMNIGGAGIVAAACAFGAVSMIMQRRWVLALSLLTLASLSREAMLISAAGCAWWLWRRSNDRKVALATFAIPLAAVGTWALYVRLRIDLEVGVSQVKEIGFPFVGFIRSIDDWLGDPIALTVGVGMLALFLLYLRRVRKDPQLLGVAFVGFVGLGILFTERVWRSYFDITRAVAPLITAYILLVFASDRKKPEFESVDFTQVERGVAKEP
jgi:hypothetical protein